MGRRASDDDELDDAGCVGGCGGESEDLGGVPAIISGELPELGVALLLGPGDMIVTPCSSRSRNLTAL